MIVQIRQQITYTIDDREVHDSLIGPDLSHTLAAIVWAHGLTTDNGVLLLKHLRSDTSAAKAEVELLGLSTARLLRSARFAVVENGLLSRQNRMFLMKSDGADVAAVGTEVVMRSAGWTCRSWVLVWTEACRGLFFASFTARLSRTCHFGLSACVTSHWKVRGR